MAGPPGKGSGLYFRVGALILAGVGLALGFVLFLTADRLGRGAMLFETYSRDSVQGLDVGAAVRYRGVQLGRVTRIALVAQEYKEAAADPFEDAFQLVLIRFSLDLGEIGETAPVEDAIKAGLRARIAAQGITGTNYLELDFLSSARFPPRQVPWTPRDTYVPLVPSTAAQVRNAAEGLLTKLEGIDFDGLVRNVAGLLENLRGQTGGEGDLARLAREASALVATLSTAVAEARIPETVGELRGTAAAARGLLEGRETRGAVANVSQAAAEFRTAAARLPAVLAALEATLRSARGLTADTQADLDPILRDLRAAAANLRAASDQVRRSPSQALFGAPPPPPEGRR